MKTLPWHLDNHTLKKDIIDPLRFEYFKWDAYIGGKLLLLPESLVLTQDEHHRAIRIAERFNNILQKLEHTLRHDDTALQALAIPKAVADIIKKESPTPLQIARYDLFPCDDGSWMVSEFNEDAPGGFNEAIALPELLATHIPPDLQFRGSLSDSLTTALRDYTRIGLVFATGYPEDLQHMLICEKILTQVGHKVTRGSPTHAALDWLGRPTLGGNRIDAAIRFYPGEWVPDLEDVPRFARFAARTPMMNPLSRIIRQSKNLFSLWEKFLPQDDITFIRQHAPATQHFDPARIPEWEQRREKLVLKHAFGRMGDSVTMGCLTKQEDWRKALDAAAKKPHDHTMQHCFKNIALDFAHGPLHPAIGVYLVNGKFAGYYSRAAEKPFLTTEAYHVTTLVEKTT